GPAGVQVARPRGPAAGRAPRLRPRLPAGDARGGVPAVRQGPRREVGATTIAGRTGDPSCEKEGGDTPERTGRDAHDASAAGIGHMKVKSALLVHGSLTAVKELGDAATHVSWDGPGRYNRFPPVRIPAQAAVG